MLKVGLTGSIACGKSFVGNLFKVYGVRIVDSDVIAREIVLPGSKALQEVKEKFGAEFILEDGNLNRPKMREVAFADKNKLNLLNSIMHPAIRQRTNELCDLCAHGLPFPESYLNIIKEQAQAKHLATCKTTPEGSTSNNSVNHSCETKIQLDLNHGSEKVIDESKTQLGIQALNEPLDPSYVLKEDEIPPYILIDIPLLFENKLESFVDRILVVDASRETQLERLLHRDGCSKETAQNIIDKQLSREYKLQHADDVIKTDTLNIEEKRAHVLKLHISYLKNAQKLHKIANS